MQMCDCSSSVDASSWLFIDCLQRYYSWIVTAGSVCRSTQVQMMLHYRARFYYNACVCVEKDKNKLYFWVSKFPAVQGNFLYLPSFLCNIAARCDATRPYIVLFYVLLRRSMPRTAERDTKQDKKKMSSVASMRDLGGVERCGRKMAKIK